MLHVPVISVALSCTAAVSREAGRAQKGSGLWELVGTKNMCFNLKLFMFVVVRQAS